MALLLLCNTIKAQLAIACAKECPEIIKEPLEMKLIFNSTERYPRFCDVTLSAGNTTRFQWNQTFQFIQENLYVAEYPFLVNSTKEDIEVSASWQEFGFDGLLVNGGFVKGPVFKNSKIVYIRNYASGMSSCPALTATIALANIMFF